MQVEKFNLDDGRVLGYQVYGKENGDPVYFFHGLPGSRLQAKLISGQALRQGICLVAFDRPGLGVSSPAPARKIVDIGSEIQQLAKHLNHSKFGVLGASCGGPYALAAAIALPDQVRHVGLMGGMGPMDVPGIRSTQLTALKLMFALAKSTPALLAPMFWLERTMFRRDPEKAVESLARMLTEPDQRMLKADSALASEFGEGINEAYRQGVGGLMQEARLIARARGFSMAQIAVPVDIYQGGLDRHVPPSMGRYMADQIPTARYHLFEREGHLSVLPNMFSRYATAFRAAYSESIQA